MTNEERWNYYESGVLQRAVAVKLIDWAGYWTNAGLDSIQSPLQKRQMRFCINQILTDLAYIIKIVSTIALSYPAIKDATIPTESQISTVVDDIMSFRIGWVADMFESDVEE